MTKPLISIIVPIYNVEMYLEKCIQSIVTQTYYNLEIILVDDGSPDSCGQICDKWANRDNRIKVIHKKNGGLSDARNVGLKAAKGEYIAFVDSDDFIDTRLYEVLIKGLTKTLSDISCCKVIKVWNQLDIGENNSEICKYKVYSPVDAMRELILDGNIQQVVWNKLYKKQVIDGIAFEKGKCNEDEFWSYQVIAKAKRVVWVDFNGYYYVQRSSSIMGQSYSYKRLDVIEAKVQRQKFLEQYFPELTQIGKYNLLLSCLYQGQLVCEFLNDYNQKKALQYLSNVSTTYKLRFKECTHFYLKNSIWILLGSRFFVFACRLRNILNIGK